MFIKRNQHLRAIKRVRVPESRNLNEGLRLDRNERVANWSQDLVIEALKRKPASFLSTYPQSDLLYERLAEFLQIEESQILLTSGIDGAIKTLCETLTVPTDHIAVIQPTYAMYQVYADMFQLNLDGVGYLEDLSLDYAGFDRCLAKKPSILFMPNPNQPIDSCLSLEELRVICRRAMKVGCIVAIDEAYYGFGSPTAVPLIDEFPNVVVMRTFSKGFGLPSIRMGAMVSSTDNMEVLAKTRFAHEGNALSYAVLEYMLDHQDVIESYNADVMHARDACKTHLQNLGIPSYGDHGNFLLLDLGLPQRAQALAFHLRECEIYIKGPWPAPLGTCVSITLGPLHMMGRFLEEVELFCHATSLDRAAGL